MSTIPSQSNDAHDRIASLRKQLEEADDPCLKLPLLDELSFYTRRVDPAEGLGYAREEFRIASSLKDRHWIMMSSIQLADYATMNSNYPLAQRHLRKAWRLLEELPDNPVKKSRVRRSEANLIFEMGKVHTAIELYDAALRYAEQSGSQVELASSLCAMCGAYIDVGLYSEGLRLATRALEVSQAIPLDAASATALLHIGRVYFALEDWEMALDNLEQSLALHERTGSSYGIARSYSGKGLVYIKLGRFEEALKWLDMALALFEKIGNPYMCGDVLANISEVWRLQNDFEKGLAYLDQADRVHGAIGNAVAKALTQIQRGEVLIEMEEWEKAITVLTDASTTLGEAGYELDMIRLEQLLAQAYEQKGDVKESLHHYKRFMEYEKILAGNEIRHQLAFHQFRPRLRSIENEKEIYQAKADRLEREVQERSHEVTLLSLRVSQDDELLKELRSRLQTMRQGSGQATALVNSLIREIDNRNGRLNSWKGFKRELEMLDGDFVQKLTTRYGSLTRSEIRICLLLKLNMSNKELGALLNISDRTVDTHRTSIRRKLGLGRDDNLVAVLGQV